MIVKERERVGFGFKELLRTFIQPNALNDEDIELQLVEIRKQEDSGRISKLEAYTDPSKVAKANKGGKRRKRGGLEIQTIDTKPVKAKEMSAREADREERE